MQDVMDWVAGETMDIPLLDNAIYSDDTIVEDSQLFSIWKDIINTKKYQPYELRRQPFSPALPVPPMTVTLPATAASQQQAMALLPFLQTHTSL